MVGQRAQLLLDRLQRPPKLRPAGQRRRDIARAGIEPHRKQAGEPAHRAREIDIGKHLLAAVTLHIQQHRIAGPPLLRVGRSLRRRTGAMPPAPVGNRHRQAGQQDVIDAAMKRRRHPRQQRLGDRRRQRQRDMPGRPGKVARRIERPVHQRQRRLAQHARPQGKLGHPLRILRVARKPLRPAPKRRAARRQDRPLAARRRLPRRRQIGNQDAPRHPVHRQMMNARAEDAPAARCRRQTTPPAPSSRTTAKAGPPPPAPPPPRSRAAPPHQDDRRRSGADNPPPPPLPAASPPGPTPHPRPSRSRSRSAS